jgi:cholesterol transport system auxiliary component
VAEPISERTLDTNRIAVVTNGINVDYVALAFWVDRAPAMVQSLIVQSFRNSGQLVQVGTNRDRVRPQFQLVSDLRAFQLNRGTGPDMVRVSLNAQLLRMPERDSVGRESFAADRAPTGSGIDAVVAAFDEALGRVMKELVAWTIRTGNRAGP